MNADVHITELLHILPKESIFAIEAYELSFTDDSTGNRTKSLLTKKHIPSHSWSVLITTG